MMEAPFLCDWNWLAPSRDHERQIITLLSPAELLYGMHQGEEDFAWFPSSVCPQRLEQAMLAKFIVPGVHGFGNPVGINHEQIARCQLSLGDGALPRFKQAEYGCGARQPLDGSIVTQQDGRVVTAVDIAQEQDFW
jgi:hypothetical protein